MSENESGEVQIRFVSTDYPALAKESISVPLSCTSAQLKALVEGLVESKLGMRFFNVSNLGKESESSFSPQSRDRVCRALF